MERAYAALTAGRSEDVLKLIPDLDRLTESNPKDDYATFYSAAMRLWKLGERTSSLLDVLSLGGDADQMLQRFARARELNGNDFRYPGFLGLTRVSAATLSGDQELLESGLTTLREAIDMNPAYGYFLRGTALSGRPREDPLFEQSLSDFVELMKACEYPKDESGMGFRYPSEAERGAHADICLNEGLVPHVFEGALISFGDVALKSGWEPARVRPIYESVKRSPTFADWAPAALLEERLANLEKRAAAFADDDALNDPALWSASGAICVGCHQRKRDTAK